MAVGIIRVPSAAGAVPLLLVFLRQSDEMPSYADARAFSPLNKHSLGANDGLAGTGRQCRLQRASTAVTLPLGIRKIFVIIIKLGLLLTTLSNRVPGR